MNIYQFSLFIATVYFLLKYGLRLGELLTRRRSWREKKEISIRHSRQKEWGRQLFLSPCILPITGLCFQQSNLWTKQEDQSE